MNPTFQINFEIFTSISKFKLILNFGTQNFQFHVQINFELWDSDKFLVIQINFEFWDSEKFQKIQINFEFWDFLFQTQNSN